ncbi:MAG: hypothetical protein DRP64_01270 [Verrucomicrobia bacterium]|nr:MAG: hypothetical protein DRP64_01270 [Verrucomicrobiota bacterium]
MIGGRRSVESTPSDELLGDVLELGFDIPKAGKYKVFLSGMKGDIFSNVKMGINGEGSPAEGAFKLAEAEGWNAHVAHVNDFELGVFDLKTKGKVYWVNGSDTAKNILKVRLQIVSDPQLQKNYFQES